MFNSKKYLVLLFFAGVSACLVSCSQAKEGREDDADQVDAVEQVDESSSPQDESGIQITEFPASETFKNAVLGGGKYRNGAFYFMVNNYELGAQTSDAGVKMCANSDQGQHIHLIVDNEPYAAKYVPEFEHEVSDGEHYILAFLSRSYHESIKTPTAHTAYKMNIQGSNAIDHSPIDGPMLFYSRPKGTYVGKANTDKVMLDFYLLNTNIGTDHFVKAEINGEKEYLFDSWNPVFLEGLPMGDNKIKLSLVDADGQLLDVPNNPVERVFTLAADPIEE